MESEQVVQAMHRYLRQLRHELHVCQEALETIAFGEYEGYPDDIAAAALREIER